MNIKKLSNVWIIDSEELRKYSEDLYDEFCDINNVTNDSFYKIQYSFGGRYITPYNQRVNSFLDWCKVDRDAIVFIEVSW